MPPLPSRDDLTRLQRALLFLTGEHDEYCPADELRAYGEGVADVAIIGDVDHYLSRKEREAAAIIGGFAQRLVGSTSERSAGTMRRMAENRRYVEVHGDRVAL